MVTCGASFDYAWDGPTHHAYTDLAILRLLPEMEVIQPGSEQELAVLLNTQYANGKPTYFRLSDHPHTVETGDVVFGRGVVLQRGSRDLTVVTAGPILGNVLEAVHEVEGLRVWQHGLPDQFCSWYGKLDEIRHKLGLDVAGIREAVLKQL